MFYFVDSDRNRKENIFLLTEIAKSNRRSKMFG